MPLRRSHDLSFNALLFGVPAVPENAVFHAVQLPL